MNVSILLILVNNVDIGELDVIIACPLNAKSPRVEKSALETLRVFLKEEIISEMKGLILDSERIVKTAAI